jgi:hypothetical protein
MPNSNIITLPVYLAGAPAEVEAWLQAGVTRPSQEDVAAVTFQAWLHPFPISPPRAWVIGAVDASQVRVMDSDLLQAAAVTHDPVWRERLTRAASALVSASDYRFGQFRRPSVLVEGRIDASALARLPNLPDVTNETVYERQLRQALRAMTGAPGDAPITALVASVVARERASLVARLDEDAKVYVYAVDEGVWYFSVTFDNRKGAAAI